MPRGQKSKLRAREKRKQSHRQNRDLRGLQATAEEKDESPSSSSSPSDCEDASPSCPDAYIPQKSQEVPPTSSPDAVVSCTSSDVESRCEDEQSASTFQEAWSTESLYRDPLIRKACNLVQFLLEKYTNKQPIMKADMLKVVNKRYKEHFPEILRRTSEDMGVIFGLDLKRVDTDGLSYTLVSKLGLSTEESLSGDSRLPKAGLLMMLLGVIFAKGNRATEEEIWEVLNGLGLYAGRWHSIYGEPRKLVMKDLVQEEYLEYRQVPDSDPPCYEFLWGPRAHAETNKMKVLEALTKINHSEPWDYPDLYEEALNEEEERARMRGASAAGHVAMARACFGATAYSSSHT
ncbi:melanoma-associated antigen B4-like [Carlito syrichta]|uniref:Melanoma-associated antigen B4-like n=1 Tax=Carlito syrichta TaxID=1868482 RepID=A0A1U7TKN8_CARSF|nr:melanoma-associated antigen B4-like [Carlito syrichta]